MKTQLKNIATHPELRSINVGKVTLHYSRHALERARTKRLQLPDFIYVKGNVVEQETRGPVTVKLVVRVPMTPTHDLVLVILSGGFVKTVWANHVHDHHATLRLDRIG